MSMSWGGGIRFSAGQAAFSCCRMRKKEGCLILRRGGLGCAGARSSSLLSARVLNAATLMRAVDAAVGHSIHCTSVIRRSLHRGACLSRRLWTEME